MSPHAATQSRREAILAAALAAFTQHGIAGASIEDIRERSGASVGSIYHHFGGKDAIAGALYIDGLRDYQDGFVAVLQASSSTRKGIEEAVRHHLEWIAGHADLARFVLVGRDAGTASLTERPLKDLNRRFFGAVQRWIRPRVQSGELRALDLSTLSALWIGPSQELARHWLSGRRKEPITDAADVLAEAAWRSLSADWSNAWP